jgi:hypothetical protein
MHFKAHINFFGTFRPIISSPVLGHSERKLEAWLPKMSYKHFEDLCRRPRVQQRTSGTLAGIPKKWLFGFVCFDQIEWMAARVCKGAAVLMPHTRFNCFSCLAAESF